MFFQIRTPEIFFALPRSTKPPGCEKIEPRAAPGPARHKPFCPKGGIILQPCRHRVQYYETDRMGVTHHSNYIRWMEEARIDFLSQIGWSYARLEELGVLSPVTAVDCRYKASTTFDDLVSIEVSVLALTNARLTIGYRMTNAAGEEVCTGQTEHCFLDREGHILRLKKDYPAFYELLAGLVAPKKV